MAKDFTKVYDENARLREEVEGLKEALRKIKARELACHRSTTEWYTSGFIADKALKENGNGGG